MIASLMAFSLHDLLPVMSLGPDGKALSPAKVVHALYEHYSKKIDGAMSTTFFTIAYGTLEPATGNYRVARAGYTPVLHIEAGGRMRVHYTKGSAVGVTEDAEIEEASGTLSQGDRLVFASDGLLFSFGDGLLESAIERLSSFADGLRGNSLEDFVGSFRSQSRETKAQGPKEDDVSLLVIERR
jgi:sigma-B regulation protein RsbU (phosphoserine phosphatase)